MLVNPFKKSRVLRVLSIGCAMAVNSGKTPLKSDYEDYTLWIND